MKTFLKFVPVCMVYMLIDGIVQHEAIRFQHIPQQNILRVIPVRPHKVQKQAPLRSQNRISLARKEGHDVLDPNIHAHNPLVQQKEQGEQVDHRVHKDAHNLHKPSHHISPVQSGNHLYAHHDSPNHQISIDLGKAHNLHNHQNIHVEAQHQDHNVHAPRNPPNHQRPLVRHKKDEIHVLPNHIIDRYAAPIHHNLAVEREAQVHPELHHPGNHNSKQAHEIPHMSAQPPSKQFTFLQKPTLYQRVRKYFSKPPTGGSSPPSSVAAVATNSTTTARTWLYFTLSSTTVKPRRTYKTTEEEETTKYISSEYVPLVSNEKTTKYISSEYVPLVSEEKTTQHISSEYVPLVSKEETTKYISSEYVPLVSEEKTTKQVSSEYVPLVSDEITTKYISSEYITDKPKKTPPISEEFVSAEEIKPVTKKAKRDDSSSYDSDGEKRRLNRLSTFSYELEFYDAGTLLNLTGEKYKFWDENREEIIRAAFPPENLTKVYNFTHDETVRAYFNYEKIDDIHMPFYKWYYRILTNPQYMKQLYNRTVVEELDYRNLSKYTPFPIPEQNQRYFMFINHLEEEIQREKEEEQNAKQEKQRVEEEWDQLLQESDNEIGSLPEETGSAMQPAQAQSFNPKDLIVTLKPRQAQNQQTETTPETTTLLKEPRIRPQTLPQPPPGQKVQPPLQAKKLDPTQTIKPPIVQRIKDSRENIFGS